MRSKTVRQSDLPSDCWLIQIWGLSACENCEARDTEECGGVEIREALGRSMRSETIHWNAKAIAEQATGCSGAGGYIAYAKELGYEFIEVVDWTSSAGDWTFTVSKDGHEWFLMFQENNYPRPGFTRIVSEEQVWYGSAAEVLELVVEEFYNW